MRTLYFIAAILLTWTPLEGQHYEFSSGLYRIGYEDDVQLTVVSDVYTHDPRGKYDLVTDANDPYIVAAASGWIRWIQDEFTQACYEVDQDGNVDCCWEMNNYVVIEHPNGEWSQYTHIQHNSADNLGLSVNDWVTVGTPIGIEGTVGCSTGDHLHFELSRPYDTAHPFDTIGGFLNGTGEMLIPVISGAGNSWMTDGDTKIANPCNDDCPLFLEVNGFIGNNGLYVARADNYIIADGNTLSPGSTVQFRAGDYISMQPGFHAQAGTKFAAIIKNCNEQN